MLDKLFLFGGPIIPFDYSSKCCPLFYLLFLTQKILNSVVILEHNRQTNNYSLLMRSSVCEKMNFLEVRKHVQPQLMMIAPIKLIYKP